MYIEIDVDAVRAKADQIEALIDELPFTRLDEGIVGGTGSTANAEAHFRSELYNTSVAYQDTFESTATMLRNICNAYEKLEQELAASIAG